jgi:hypothetical protein
MLFFLNFHGSSFVSGKSKLQTSKDGSVKQFLVEPMLFAVGMGWRGGGDGGEEILSPCEAQSKQQQNEKTFKWGERKKLNYCVHQIFSFCT